MQGMPLNLEWGDVALRLALTVLGGGIIGFNRGEHGRPAGLRTTILVALAASASMIEANLLLPTVGKSPGNFAVLDLMRLPLGILSGMGFIGAGAILREGGRVQGVTTAATMWYVTMMGICMGGGQLGLGMTLAVLGLFVLTVLKWVEDRTPQEVRGRLLLLIDKTGPAKEDVSQMLHAAGLRIDSVGMESRPSSGRVKLEFRLRLPPTAAISKPPPLFDKLADQPGVIRLKWRP